MEGFKFKMKKVGIIFGGMSTEHEVSITSGISVIKNLQKDKYIIIPIYISLKGEWFLYTKDINEIHNYKIGEGFERDNNYLIKIENPFNELKKLDVVFPVLHGLYGEDGSIQGVFELLKLNYVGCKVLGSSLCMDKIYTKAILEKAGINQVKYAYVKRINDKYVYYDKKFNELEFTQEELADEIVKNLGLPVFVKPSNSGSSVGIKKVNKEENLITAVNYASEFDEKILIEEGINARELECSVIGNDDVSTSCVGEIIPAEDFYSFDAKYNNAESKLIIPAKIDDEVADKIRKISVKAFKAVDAKGLARIDFFLEKNTNEIYLNEINTMPGFTSISMYPQLWKKCRKPYSKLLDELIEYAEE